MYSQRLRWSVPQNPLSIHLTHLRASGVPLFDLTSSNPTCVVIDYPHEAIGSAFGSVPDFAYHADPCGMLTARQSIQAYYSARSIDIETSQILLTASTSEAYGLLFKLLCNPGDRVLVPTPSYPLFEYLSSLELVEAVPYAYRFDGGWYIDFEDFSSKLGEQVKAIVVVNPNNPVGSFVRVDEMERLLDLAVRFEIPIISDEVFYDYEWTPSPSYTKTFISQNRALSFSLNGLSKIAGMPQMKLGWIALGGPQHMQSEAAERLELLLDTYLSVNTPIQRALPDLLNIGDSIRHELLAHISQNRETLKNVLEGSPAHMMPAEAGWSALVRLPSIKTEDEWCLGLLEQQQVVTQPGYFFDLPHPAFIVLSLITDPEVFAEGVLRIRRLVQQTAA